MAGGVDGLPGDQHGHHRGLTRASGQLQCHPQQVRVGFVVGAFQLLQHVFAALADLRCHLREPDRCFGRFDLAVKGPDALELVVAPVLQQPGRLR